MPSRVSFSFLLILFGKKIVFCLFNLVSELFVCWGLIDIAAQLDDGKGLAQTVSEVKDANKRGALHFAAREGKIEMCKFLVQDLKLDINVQDEDGSFFLLYIYHVCVV